MDYPRTIRGDFGDVTLHSESVAVAGDSQQLRRWATRPGHSWPCSVLRGFDNVCAWFDRGGLVELQGYRPDFATLGLNDEYDTDDIPGDEFSAWSSDVLRDVLPKDHPAYPVAVGQFESAR